MSNVICPKCSKSISNKKQLARHLRTHDSETFLCPHCPEKKFSTRHSLGTHQRKFHNNAYSCNICSQTFNSSDKLIKHIYSHAATNVNTSQIRSSDETVVNRHDLDYPLDYHDNHVLEKRKASAHSNSPSKKRKRKSSTSKPPPPPTPSPSELKMRELSSDSETDFTDEDEPSFSGAREQRKSSNGSKKEKRKRLWNPKDLCEMKVIDRKWAPALKTVADRYSVTMKDQMESETIEEALEKLRIVLKHIIRTLKENSYERSFARIVIEAEGLWTPISMTYKLLDSIHPEELMDRIAEVLQSDESIDFSKCVITAICTELPVPRGTPNLGSPFACRLSMKEDEFVRRKNSLKDPYRSHHPKDSFCFPRAIVLGQKMINSPKDSKSLQKFINKSLKQEATVLAEQVGHKPGEGAPSELWPKYQQVLEEQLIVWGSKSPRPLYHGPFKTKQIHVYVSVDEQHAYLVTSPKGLLDTDAFCPKCLKGFNPQFNHRCEEGCRLCHNSKCQSTKTKMGSFPCEDCNLIWPSEECREAHKLNRCNLYAKCLICHRSVKRQQLTPPEEHHCMEQWCVYCKHWTTPGHRCFMARDPDFAKPDPSMDTEELEEQEDQASSVQKKTQKKKKRDVLNVKTFYADFESKIDQDHNHIPHLLVIVDEEGNPKKWEGPDSAVELLKEMRDNKKFRNGTVVMQWGSGYDFMFILKAALRTLKKKPRLIKRGSRILSLKIPGIGRFVDSVSFIPSSLRNYPKIFGLDKGVRKGYFPYKYASHISDDYSENALPPLEAFDVDYCSPKESEDLKIWYKEQQRLYEQDPSKIYNLKEEEYQYCLSDCQILRLGFSKLIQLYKDKYSVHPLTHISAPSLLNSIYRGQFLPENEIALTPEMGFRKSLRRHYSIPEVCWMETMNILEGLDIQHARNSYPSTIGKYQPDGVRIDGEGRTHVYEFLGCHFHGHDRCQVNRNSTETWKQRAKELHKQTQERLDFFRNHGFKVHAIYGCEYRKSWQSDPVRKKLHKELYHHFNTTKDSPLNPRDSLRGGRTGMVRSKADATPDVGINYVDFTSLYPSINLGVDENQQYPTGWPKVSFLNHSDVDLKDLNGFVQCSVIIPNHLHLGPLPYYVNNKLSFPLCRTCNEEKNEKPCQHSDELRAIQGTFTDPEVKLALRLGCRFFDIKEIWQYPRKSRNLFKDFIAAAYATKLESSFKDHWTPEQRQQCFDDAIKLGITLDPSKCEDNPGLRSFAKFILNQFWGFMCKAGIQTSDVFLSDYSDYLPMLLNPGIDVSMVDVLDKDLIWVSYQEKEGVHSPNVQVMLGCFTTAFGRVKLFEALEVVGEDICYFDTDSLVTLYKRDKPFPLPLGEALGMLKNEIDTYGVDYEIKEFRCLGSKCYSCMVVHKETGKVKDFILRAKGISINAANKSVVTHESYNQLVQFKLDHREDAEGESQVMEESFKLAKQFNIRRDIKKQTLKSVYLQKKIQPTSNGRYIADDSGLTRPYGFCPL